MAGESRHLGWHLSVCLLTDEGVHLHEYSLSEVKGESHITPHCVSILQGPPPSCYEIKEFSAWRMCKAFEIMQEKKVDFSEAMKLAWSEAMKICKR
jgi:hypothetical protein